MENKRIDIVHKPLRLGTDVNAHKGKKGNTLCLAIHSKERAPIWAIMERSPEVNAHGGEFGNALSAAIDAELEDIAVELLE